MELGEKIKRLRLQHGLTQEELALRCDLSKGFISQLERDLTSPSIATLKDVLECLGTDLRTFFSEPEEEKIVFGTQDVFDTRDEERGTAISWLIPNAQKKDIEPIMVTLEPGAKTETDLPHMGEEFGHVLSGAVTLVLGDQRYRVRKGDSFSYKPSEQHYLMNTGKTPATVLWVCTPPNF